MTSDNHTREGEAAMSQSDSGTFNLLPAWEHSIRPEPLIPRSRSARTPDPTPAQPAQERPLTGDPRIDVHLRHCYRNEYPDGCKYGPSDEDCPARPDQPLAAREGEWRALTQTDRHYAIGPQKSFQVVMMWVAKELADYLNAQDARIAALEAQLAAAEQRAFDWAGKHGYQKARAETAEAALAAERTRAGFLDNRLAVLRAAAQDGALRTDESVKELVKAALWYGDKAFIAALTPAQQPADAEEE